MSSFIINPYRFVSAGEWDVDDDFTSYVSDGNGGNWTSNDTGKSFIDESADVIHLELEGSNSDNNGMVYDIGSTISSSAWILRLHKVNWSSITNNGVNACWIVLSSADETVSATTSQDGIGMRIFFDTTLGDSWNAIDIDGGSLNAGNEASQIFDISTATDYYIEIIRDGSSYTIEWFSDADFSTSLDSVTGTVTGSPANLQYIKFTNFDGGSGGTNTFTIDRVQFNDGTTAPP